MNDNYTLYAIQMGDWYWSGEFDKWRGRPVFSDKACDARRFKTQTAADEFASEFPEGTIYQIAVLRRSPPELKILDEQGELVDLPDESHCPRWKVMS